MAEIEIVIAEAPTCPQCGAEEVENPDDPMEDWVWHIRAYRVCDEHGRWWSQCLECVNTPGKGWFCHTTVQ